MTLGTPAGGSDATPAAGIASSDAARRGRAPSGFGSLPLLPASVDPTLPEDDDNHRRSEDMLFFSPKV